jgi:hypothetical protein
MMSSDLATTPQWLLVSHSDDSESPGYLPIVARDNVNATSGGGLSKGAVQASHKTLPVPSSGAVSSLAAKQP